MSLSLYQANNVASRGVPIDNVYQDGILLKQKQKVLVANYQRDTYDAINISSAGSSRTFRIKKGPLLGGSILKVTLKDVNANVFNAANSTDAGFMYNIINNYRVKVGSSDQYTWSGTANYINVVRQANSYEDAKRILELGGPARFNSGTVTFPTNVDTTYTYYLHLSLPTSVISRPDSMSIPFDSSILTEDIEIEVYFNSFRDLYQGANAANPVNSMDVSLVTHNMMLVDQSQSIAQRIKEGKRYNHLFIYPNRLCKQQELKASANGCGSTMTFNGFLDGNTIGFTLLFNLVLDDYDNANDSRRIYLNIKNLRVDIAGQRVLEWQDSEELLTSIQENGKETIFFNVGTADAGASSYYTDISVAQMNFESIHNHLFSQSGVDLSGRSVSFTFDVPADGTYELTCIQNMEGAVSTAKNSSRIIFRDFA